MPAAARFSKFSCLAVALCLCANVVFASDASRYGVFVYSDFCISPMSGDLAGERITLQRFVDGDTLIYEYTDGSTHAVVANNLMFDAESRTVRFEIRDNGGLNATVSGRFSRDFGILTLQGMLFHESETVTLQRTKNFAAALRECKELRNESTRHRNT